jgi:hypothetical protein
MTRIAPIDSVEGSDDGKMKLIRSKKVMDRTPQPKE